MAMPLTAKAARLGLCFTLAMFKAYSNGSFDQWNGYLISFAPWQGPLHALRALEVWGEYAI